MRERLFAKRLIERRRASNGELEEGRLVFRLAAALFIRGSGGGRSVEEILVDRLSETGHVLLEGLDAFMQSGGDDF